MNGAILARAQEIINGEKQDDYGDPSVCCGKIAAMWSAYLGREISRKDVACMMVLFKMARESQRHKPDNLLDAAGYIGLAGDMAGEKI